MGGKPQDDQRFQSDGEANQTLWMTSHHWLQLGARCGNVPVTLVHQLKTILLLKFKCSIFTNIFKSYSLKTSWASEQIKIEYAAQMYNSSVINCGLVDSEEMGRLATTFHHPGTVLSPVCFCCLLFFCSKCTDDVKKNTNNGLMILCFHSSLCRGFKGCDTNLIILLLTFITETRMLSF